MGTTERVTEIVQIVPLVEKYAKMLDLGSQSFAEIEESAYGFVNAIRRLKPHQEPKVANLDVFTSIVRLCGKDLEHRSVNLDLLSVIFVHCSVHKSLVCLVRDFAQVTSQRQPIMSQLRELCGTVVSGYRPGFFSILAKLDIMENLDARSLSFLALNLGPVLRMVWLPLWTQKAHKSLYADVVGQNLIVATTVEAKLDFLIASRAHEPLEWYALKDHDSEPLKLFVYTTVRRALLFPRWLPKPFYQFCEQTATDSTNNDCFTQSSGSSSFNLSVLMEILDHPSLNFFEEPHLTLLLTVSVYRLRMVCIEGDIMKLHLELGKMGSTHSLLGLLNITQYLLCRFLIKVGSLISIGRYYDKNKSNWAIQQSLYQLPADFDRIIPDIPPISRSSFGFDSSVKPKVLESCQAEIIASLLNSLNSLIVCNQTILQYYEDNKIDITTCRANYPPSDSKTTIENRSTLEILHLCFVSNTSSLFLSKLLSDEKTLALVVGRQEALVQSRLLHLNLLYNFELLLKIFKGLSLYQLVKFCSRISMAGLKLQGVCMNLLNHVFFETNNPVTETDLLSSKSTMHVLYEYINTWNDGSQLYQRFYSDIFKMAQPAAHKVQIAWEPLLSLIPELKGDPNILQRTGKNPDFSKILQAPKYNAHASSFVPASKSFNSISLEASTPNAHSANSQLTPSSVEFPQTTVKSPGQCEFTGATFPKEMHQKYFEGGVVNASSAPRISSSSTKWDSNCFSQGSTISSETHSAVVNTGKEYILGGHNRATNNSRAQSVHVDRFEYMRQ